MYAICDCPPWPSRATESSMIRVAAVALALVHLKLPVCLPIRRAKADTNRHTDRQAGESEHQFEKQAYKPEEREREREQQFERM